MVKQWLSKWLNIPKVRTFYIHNYNEGNTVTYMYSAGPETTATMLLLIRTMEQRPKIRRKLFLSTLSCQENTKGSTHTMTIIVENYLPSVKYKHLLQATISVSRVQ